MRIGEIAERTCVSKSIIRYYESIHLIPPPRRDDSGYRSYSEADAERICLVVGARVAGLSVADIRAVLRMQDEGRPPGPQLLHLLEDKTKELRKRRERLEAIDGQLARLHALGIELEARQTIGKSVRRLSKN